MAQQGVDPSIESDLSRLPRAARRHHSLRYSSTHQLEPIQEPVPGCGSTKRWRATGDDPQFLFDLEKEEVLEGWYLIEARYSAQQDIILEPCLYFDFGNGIEESSRRFLKQGLQRIHGVLRFTAPVRLIRFDPSTTPCEFELGHLSLRRIGRSEAASRMLEDIDPHNMPLRLRCFLDADENELEKEVIELYKELLSRESFESSPDVKNYRRWVRASDKAWAGERARLQRNLHQFGKSVLISILLPVYNTEEQWLRRCIDSVLAQYYQNWELCIADDASTDPRTRHVLASLASKDHRIRIERRKHNGHISAASNSALALARGEYVVLLDHDDELHPDALLHIAHEVASNRDLGLLYTDEDKISCNGDRSSPYFKPDWNPDLLLSHNVINHLGAYRTDLVREIGGFREGYEGSQDHDLALRCIERLRPDQIRHIPKVLYHWRAIPGSTALGVDAKSYAVGAGLRAIGDHLLRRGYDAEAVSCPISGQYRVRYALPNPLPMVSLIVPTRDRYDLLSKCVDSLLNNTSYSKFEVIIVDNGSREPETLEYLRQIARDHCVKVLKHDAPFNYSALNNLAIAQSAGTVVGLINNDIETINSDWLDEMVSHAVRPEIGVVGAKLLYPDGTIQHAGVVLGIHGVAGHVYSRKPSDFPGSCNRARLVQNLSAVTGACQVIRKSVYEEVGGLDEGLAVAFNDIDFCLRVQAKGYRNLWTPYARLYHHESASRGHEDTPEKQARFSSEAKMMRDRWTELLDKDPAYNPNFALYGEPFSLSSLAI